MSTASVEQLNTQAAEIPQDFLEEQTQKGLVLIRDVGALEKINDENTYLQVCSKAKEAAANIKLVEAYMQPYIDRAHAAHKRLTQKRAELLNPFEIAKDKFGGMITTWQLEQQRETERREEAERKKILEQQRSDLAVQAEQLAAEGRIEEGVAVLEQSVIPVMTPVMTTTVPKVAGISKPTIKYTGLVFDLKALVAAVAKGDVPLAVLAVNQRELDKLASVLKESMNYPGVRLNKAGNTSIRG